ncbi:MAG: hypothetical protein GWP03_04695 [Proteobacteria bacterium]|nr:hypothetical protein [Pseudomonadota bacterium]
MGKSKKILIFLLLAVMVFAGCTKYDNFADRARIKQADNSLDNVKNALERYYLDNISYPPNGADLKQYVGKFFTAKDTAGKVVDKWDTDIVNAFYNKKLYYETDDSLKAFFIWARATDKLHTIVSTGTKSFKDPVKIKQEKEKEKKALEKAIRKNRLKMAREKRLKSRRKK